MGSSDGTMGREAERAVPASTPVALSPSRPLALSHSGDAVLTYGLMLLAVSLWAGNWVAGKLAVQQMSPLFLATARYVIAMAVLLPWLTSRRQLAAIGRKDVLPLVGMGLSYVVGTNLGFLVGVRFAPASDGALIQPGFAPVLAAGLAALLLKERLSRSQLAGLPLALLGLALLLGVAEDASGGQRLLGDLLFLGGGALWAVQMVIARAHGSHLSSAVATTYSILFGTVAMLPFALLEGGWRALETLSLPGWASFAYLAVLGTVFPMAFWYYGIQRLGVSRSSAFSYLIPLGGVALSVLLLHERLQPLQILGGALVLGGVVLVNRTRFWISVGHRNPTSNI